VLRKGERSVTLPVARGPWAGQRFVAKIDAVEEVDDRLERDS
jgi:hypothetical protein